MLRCEFNCPLSVSAVTYLAPVLRFYEMYNTHNVNLLDGLLAPGYVGEINGHKVVGLESAKAVIGAFLAAFPDVHYVLEDTFGEANKVVVRWRATGTQVGVFGELAPIHKRVTMVGITIFELKGEQISALWNVWDVHGLLAQLRS